MGKSTTQRQLVAFGGAFPGDVFGVTPKSKRNPHFSVNILKFGHCKVHGTHRFGHETQGKHNRAISSKLFDPIQRASTAVQSPPGESSPILSFCFGTLQGPILPRATVPAHLRPILLLFFRPARNNTSRE
ncbi:ribosomal protein S12 methylthiotransferase [Anopheles sinensis]|uniref:Ribosomal protein S12 methylthiotransferase n=1 Tax=Anopheles sinensis TaxID=74873 RepID=A0A084WDF2_ANOSI|nr:ribosomal protein S12 methylthiotransferase [Anopheles sinensis]